MLIIFVPEHDSAVEGRGNKKVCPQRIYLFLKREDRHTCESGRKISPHHIPVYISAIISINIQRDGKVSINSGLAP